MGAPSRKEGTPRIRYNEKVRQLIRELSNSTGKLSNLILALILKATLLLIRYYIYTSIWRSIRV